MPALAGAGRLDAPGECHHDLPLLVYGAVEMFPETAGALAELLDELLKDPQRQAFDGEASRRMGARELRTGVL
jgi:hypothetical protein